MRVCESAMRVCDDNADYASVLSLTSNYSNAQEMLPDTAHYASGSLTKFKSTDGFSASVCTAFSSAQRLLVSYRTLARSLGQTWPTQL